MTIHRSIAVACIGIALAGCATSGGSSSEAGAPPAKNTEGCATAQAALGAYSQTMNAMQDKTATVADSASGFGKVSRKLSDVALIAGPELAPHAKAASVAAGRLRVALTEVDSTVDVSTEAAALRTEAQAISAYCQG